MTEDRFRINLSEPANLSRYPIGESTKDLLVLIDTDVEVFDISVYIDTLRSLEVEMVIHSLNELGSCEYPSDEVDCKVQQCF